MREGEAEVVSNPSPILPSGEFAENLCLELAGKCFSIEGIPLGWHELLPGRLLACTTGQRAASGRTIRIKLSPSEHLRPLCEPHDTNQTTRVSFSHDEVKFVSDWCEGHFTVAPDTPVQLLVHVQASPWFGDVIENMLRILVAYDVLQRGGVMLHCAAIVKGSWAVVLFGHSGAGKSTVSQLALDCGYSIISDDINIIEPCGQGWQVTPVPFSGTLNAVSDIVDPVYLSGLYRLNHADEDHAEPCSSARAVSLLAGSAPFVNQDAHRFTQLIDLLSTLSAEVSVQDLYFTKGVRFLQNVFSAGES
jgi:hypothetical protein